MTSKRPAKSDAALKATPAPEPERAKCNVPSYKHGQCRHEAEWHGLCAAHRATMRGLADPKDAG